MLNELNHDNTGTGKAVDFKDTIPPTHMSRCHGGVAIVWKKQLDICISPLSDGNKRLQSIEIRGAQPLFVISVYLPCKGSTDSIEEFRECIDLLNEINATYKDTHNILLGGDLNENPIHFTNSKKSNYLLEFIKEHNLVTKDLGPTFIHHNGYDPTCIDFFLYSKKYSSSIIKIIKLEDIPGTYPIITHCSKIEI